MQVYCRPLSRDGLVTVSMQHHYSRENPAPGWLTLPPTQPQPTPEQSTYHLSQDQPAPDHTPLNLTHLPVQMTVLRALTEVNYLSKMFIYQRTGCPTVNQKGKRLIKYYTINIPTSTLNLQYLSWPFRTPGWTVGLTFNRVYFGFPVSPSCSSLKSGQFFLIWPGLSHW